MKTQGSACGGGSVRHEGTRDEEMGRLRSGASDQSRRRERVGARQVVKCEGVLFWCALGVPKLRTRACVGIAVVCVTLAKTHGAMPAGLRLRRGSGGSRI